MKRTIIPCQVRCEQVLGAGVVAGAAGSGGDAVLQLEFGPMWEGLVKYVTFRNALKEDPVTMILTTDMMERIVVECGGEARRVVGPHACSVPAQGCAGKEILVYNVPIPAKAKALAGQMGVVVQGYAVAEDGSRIEGAVMTANAYYKILPADYAPVEDGSVTPTLSQQLQGEIEKIKKDILGAAGAADAKEVALEAVRKAEAARTGAETARDRAEERAQAAAGEAEKAGKAAGEAGSARAGAQAALAGSEEARRGAQEARGEAEAARTRAEEARDRAQLAQVEAQEAERRGKGYRDEALAARDAAREARDGAERARDTAVSAKETAEECRTQAWTERLLAQDARDRAEEAGEQAGLFRDDARTAQKESQAARDEAVLALQQIRMDQEDIRGEQGEIKELGAEVRRLRDETVIARDETLTLRDEVDINVMYAQDAHGGAQEAQIQAEEAAREAARSAALAREIAGVELVTPTELGEILKGKANVPLMGPAELAEGLEAGGVLFVTDGEITMTARGDVEQNEGKRI